MNDPHFYMVYSDVSNDNTICSGFSIKDAGQKSVPTMIGSSVTTRVERLARKLLVAKRLNKTEDIERIALTISRAYKNSHVAIFFKPDDSVECITGIGNEHLDIFQNVMTEHTAEMVAKYGERQGAA